MNRPDPHNLASGMGLAAAVTLGAGLTLATLAVWPCLGAALIGAGLIGTGLAALILGHLDRDEP